MVRIGCAGVTLRAAGVNLRFSAVTLPLPGVRGRIRGGRVALAAAESALEPAESSPDLSASAFTPAGSTLRGSHPALRMSGAGFRRQARLAECQAPAPGVRLCSPGVRRRFRESRIRRQVSRPASPVEEPVRLGTDFAFSQHGLIPPRPARHRDGRTRFELGRMGLIPAGFTSDFSTHSISASARRSRVRTPAQRPLALSPGYRNHRQRRRQAQGGASPALVDCGSRGTLGLPQSPSKKRSGSMIEPEPRHPIAGPPARARAPPSTRLSPHIPIT
jgi:hypothetical protein